MYVTIYVCICNVCIFPAILAFLVFQPRYAVVHLFCSEKRRNAVVRRSQGGEQTALEVEWLLLCAEGLEPLKTDSCRETSIFGVTRKDEDSEPFQWVGLCVFSVCLLLLCY